MNPEQRAIYISKPIARMRWFASLLNWHGLQLEPIVFSPDECIEHSVPLPGIITYYVTTDLKFNLQINEYPICQSVTYHATIKAERHGILHTPWYSFTLHEDHDLLRAEAELLRPFLDRSLFKQQERLRQLKADPTVALLRTFKKRRGRANKESFRLRNELTAAQRDDR